MRRLRALLIRAAGFVFPARRRQEFDDELQSHLDMQVADNLRAGMTVEEARRAALVRFGSLESVREAYRERSSIPLIESSLQDARYALRTLRRAPGVSAVGILVMALAIGANTAVFSVVDAVLLNPLPYEEPERIVSLTYVSAGGIASGERALQISVPDFLDWQRDATSFAAMAYYTTGRGPVVAGSVAEYAVVTRVTPQFFQVFRVQPTTGRFFSDDEKRGGADAAAIVSERYARQQFGESASALGHTLRIGPRPASIVGVLPDSFVYPAETDIWLPLDPSVGDARQRRRGNNFRAIARLDDLRSLEQAQAELTGISERLERQYPDTNTNVRVLVTPLQHEIVGHVESMLYLLLAAIGVVLLIACATMATLLLAKATARVPEIAVRTALGASRSRIVRQLLVESLVQAFAAGAIGFAIAIWGTGALVTISPADVPRLSEVAVNSRVLLFTLALCTIVSILFGLPPALQAARSDVHAGLSYTPGRVAGTGNGRTREILVVAEIALAVVLVISGALLVRSLIALQRTPLGFEPEHVLAMQATAPPRSADWSDSRAFFEGLLDDIRQMPGVVAAGAAMGPPGRPASESGYWLDRMPETSPLNSARPALMNVIAPGTFAALGIPIRRGRDFRPADRRDAPQVAIINEALAHAAFRERDPIGTAIVAGYDSKTPMTIVGVVRDIRQHGPARDPQPEIYMPYQQHFYNGATLHVLVRTAGDPNTLAAPIQRKAHDRAPSVSVRVMTLEALLREHVAAPQFRAWLLSLFAGIALCLAMAGVYGVMTFDAGQRSKEIGVRLALGANPRNILSLMVGRGLKLTVIGLALGVFGAIVSTRLFDGMLFNVKPTDLTTYAGVVAVLGALSLLATYVPARRASRIDPVLVLRQD